MKLHFCFIIALISSGCRLPQPEGLAFVSNEDSNTISIIDLSKLDTINSFYVGWRPRGLKISPNGKFLYVALSGSPKCSPSMLEEECDKRHPDKSKDGIAEVDIRSMKVVRVLPSGSDPEQFDISPDGRFIFVSNEDVGLLSIIDVEKAAVVRQIPVGEEPEGVKVSPDGRIVMVTNESDGTLSVIDVASQKLAGQVKVGNRPRDIVFSDDGISAYVSNELDGTISIVDTKALQETGRIDLKQNSLPMGLQFDEGNDILFIATGRGGSVITADVRAKKILSETVVGKRPWGLALTGDKSHVITANGSSNDVSVVEASTGIVVKKINVGNGPWGVVVMAL